VTEFGAQLRVELTTLLRNGEQLLLTLGIPVLLLVFFATVEVMAMGDGDRLDFLAPGVLALATMSSAMVGLGIATGFERSYLVLKRLGATPLGRARLVGAKIAAVMAVQLVQFAVLVPVAVAQGWRPSGARWGLAAAGVVVGTAAFAGLGLLLAGRLRGEINLAAQNGLYIVLLLLGGMIIPLAELPSPARTVAHLLPAAALADVLRSTLGGEGLRVGASWITLASWAVAAPTAASRLFRWW
jgi:ABC-2 type transport system permease protein